MKTNRFQVHKTWKRVIQYLDDFLDRLYCYRGEYKLPEAASSLIWSLPPTNSFTSRFIGEEPNPEEYFLQYFQSQGYGPTKNECVTTSVVMSMNMMKDRIAWSQEQSQHFPDRLLGDYTRELDNLGIRGWRYRFSTNSWLPGMMTPWQAVLALKDFAALLRTVHSKNYKVKLSGGHHLDDLIEFIKVGRIILIHGARRMTLSSERENYNLLLPWLGGMPHTMVLVGYDGPSDQWVLLNPAKPWLTDRNSLMPKGLDRMSTKDLLEFWGRRFLFYPPRFAVTVISSEN